MSAALRALVAIAGGLALDAVLGDPVVPWHPVRLVGKLAARCETLARRLWRAPAPGTSEAPTLLSEAPGRHGAAPVRTRYRLAGASAWLAVVVLSSGAAWILCALARALHPLAGAVADMVVVWAAIAPADLAAHAARVRRALESAESGEPEGLSRARAAVSMIVGRDVSALDAAGVARAAVESVAESSVDGAAAPIFWAALLGPAAAFAYRAVNTMDSMFGHKDERYVDFGLVPARADDAANWLPARASSVLACALAPLAGGSARAAFSSFRRWRLAHESPNAGHPESAYAGALALRLGGPSRYAEGVIDKPWMNPGGGEARARDLRRAVVLMYAQTLASSAAFLAFGASLGSALGAVLRLR